MKTKKIPYLTPLTEVVIIDNHDAILNGSLIGGGEDATFELLFSI